MSLIMGFIYFFSNNVSLGQTLLGPVVLWVGQGRAEIERITESGAVKSWRKHKKAQYFLAAGGLRFGC